MQYVIINISNSSMLLLLSHDLIALHEKNNLNSTVYFILFSSKTDGSMPYWTHPMIDSCQM